MRISSLDSFSSLDCPYAMLLESSETIQAFPPSTNPVTFCFSLEQLHGVAELPLILVDAEAHIAVSILREYVNRNQYVEYWAPRENASRLRELARLADEFAVSGVCITGEWIQLQIGLATADDRSSADWVAGLAAAPVCTEERRDVDSVTSAEVTLRGLVISRITPLAKPLKKYLPGWMVILLYKILEKIR